MHLIVFQPMCMYACTGMFICVYACLDPFLVYALICLCPIIFFSFLPPWRKCLTSLLVLYSNMVARCHGASSPSSQCLLFNHSSISSKGVWEEGRDQREISRISRLAYFSLVAMASNFPSRTLHLALSSPHISLIKKGVFPCSLWGKGCELAALGVFKEKGDWGWESRKCGRLGRRRGSEERKREMEGRWESGKIGK